jgi:hypothetical protein
MRSCRPPLFIASSVPQAYIERAIGSIRRECIDHLIAFNEASLYRHLKSFMAYYHETRTHLSLEKDSPASRSGLTNDGRAATEVNSLDETQNSAPAEYPRRTIATALGDGGQRLRFAVGTHAG